MTEKDNSYEEYVPESDFEEKEPFNLGAKIKSFLGSSYWTVAVVILISIISFSLGKYFTIKEARPPVKITTFSQATSTASTNTNMAGSPVLATPKTNTPSNSGTSARLPVSEAAGNDGQVVGSKNGTKYHYPWCPGAKQIAAKNLITFNSTEEARKAGYTPASNCKGLQ